MIPDYILRLPIPDDFNFMHSAWIKGAYEAEPNNFIPRELFLDEQDKHIRRCLKNFETHLIVHPDEPNQIFGFICFSFVGQSLIVHWLYLKNIWRYKRLGLSMVPSILDDISDDWREREIVVTQYSKHFKKLRERYHLVYDPYYIGGND